MERVFKLPSTTFIGGKENALPLKEILNRLENTYCRSIGVEFMFINSLEQCNWIRQRMETPGIMEMEKEQKRLILARLTRATGYFFFLLQYRVFTNCYNMCNKQMCCLNVFLHFVNICKKDILN